MDDDKPDNPVIIAEARRAGGELTVSETVMRFDLSDATFLVFHSAAGGDVDVVYQSPNGNIGWNDTGSREVGHADGVNAAVTD